MSKGACIFFRGEGGLRTPWGLKTPVKLQVSLIQGGVEAVASMDPIYTPLVLNTGCPKKHGNSVTNSISSLL